MKTILSLLAALTAVSAFAIPSNDRTTITADLDMRAESAVLWREWYSRDAVESAYFLGRVEGLQLANKVVAASVDDESYDTLARQLAINADVELLLSHSTTDPKEIARYVGRVHGIEMAAALIAARVNR